MKEEVKEFLDKLDKLDKSDNVYWISLSLFATITLTTITICATILKIKGLL